MGDIADDHRDAMFEAEAELALLTSRYRELDDEELIERVSDLVDSIDYEQNEYSKLIRGILRTYQSDPALGLTRKQKFSLAFHLAKSEF